MGGGYKYTPSSRVLLECLVSHMGMQGRRLDQLFDAIGNVNTRFDCLYPLLPHLKRLVHEKETLQKQLATLQAQLREANAYMAQQRVPVLREAVPLRTVEGRHFKPNLIGFCLWCGKSISDHSPKFNSCPPVAA